MRVGVGYADIMRIVRSTGFGVALISAQIACSANAQQIQRCEDTGGRITYSNAACPEGTHSSTEVKSAPAPSPEAQAAARDKAARDAQAAAALAKQRQSQQTSVAQQQQKEIAANCAYMRGEIDSLRRLRNVVVNRPFYSLDDLQQMDDHAARLVADYRRVCG